MSRQDSLICALATLVLLLVIAGQKKFDDAPVIHRKPLDIPLALPGWHGKDIPHTQGERGVLGEVDLIKRDYRNARGDTLWLIAHQTPAASRLHNVYVSLIASGAEPAMRGEKTIETAAGLLNVTRLTLKGMAGQPYEGYLWYQWRDGKNRLRNAPHRWAWYTQVLEERLRGEIPAWRLVEIVTPATPDSEKTLDAFAKTFYELPENPSEN